MLNILLLSHSFFPNVGGIETHSNFLINELLSNSFQVRVITWTPLRNNIEFSLCKVIRDPTNFELFENFKWCDLVIENNPSMRLSWPLLFYKRKHLIFLHTWININRSKQNFFNQFKIKWLKKADEVVSVSSALASKIFPSATIIHNSYDDKIFKRKVYIKKSKKFVFLGRLVSDKGADLAIEFLKEILDRNVFKEKESLILTIIGDGASKSELVNLVEEKNLSDYVVFEGILKDEQLVDKLNEHEYILIPSRWNEPFGIVALEGIACGCLPIVSSGGGLPEAIGNCGITFNNGEVSSMITNFIELVNNPVKEKNLRENFPSHLQSHSSVVIGNQIISLLNKI